MLKSHSAKYLTSCAATVSIATVPQGKRRVFGKSPKPKQWGYGPGKGLKPMSESHSDAEKSQPESTIVILDLNFGSWDSMTPEQREGFAASLHAAIVSDLTEEDESESK